MCVLMFFSVASPHQQGESEEEEEEEASSQLLFGVGVGLSDYNMESSSGASRAIMAPTVTVSGIGSTNSGISPGSHNSPMATTTLVMKPTAPAESITSITAHRRKRLVRSENVCCSHHQGWEAIFRESLLHMAWPISMSLSSDQTDSLAMTDFLPLKIRSVFPPHLYLLESFQPKFL